MNNIIKFIPWISWSRFISVRPIKRKVPNNRFQLYHGEDFGNEHRGARGCRWVCKSSLANHLRFSLYEEFAVKCANSTGTHMSLESQITASSSLRTIVSTCAARLPSCALPTMHSILIYGQVVYKIHKLISQRNWTRLSSTVKTVLNTFCYKSLCLFSQK